MKNVHDDAAAMFERVRCATVKMRSVTAPLSGNVINMWVATMKRASNFHEKATYDTRLPLSPQRAQIDNGSFVPYVRLSVYFRNILFRVFSPYTRTGPNICLKKVSHKVVCTHYMAMRRPNLIKKVVNRWSNFNTWTGESTRTSVTHLYPGSWV